MRSTNVRLRLRAQKASQTIDSVSFADLLASLKGKRRESGYCYWSAHHEHKLDMGAHIIIGKNTRHDTDVEKLFVLRQGLSIVLMEAPITGSLRKTGAESTSSRIKLRKYNSLRGWRQTGSDLV